GKGKGRRPEEEQEGGLNVTFTIQLFMHGKEVGSIIRKNRESVKKMCGESGELSLEAGNATVLFSYDAWQPWIQ
uniref:Uncharacterized protein n=1 Tax=Balaenoptera musculus TaxID=9771 RepID=A0A8C0E7U6_BALMU